MSKHEPRNWRIAYMDKTDTCPSFAQDFPAGWKLISAYLFDPGFVTHCCEMTVSRWIILVAQFIVPDSQASWDLWRVKDEDSDEYEDQNCLLDEYERLVPGSDCYMHASEVHSLPWIDSEIAVTENKDGETNEDEATRWAWDTGVDSFYSEACVSTTS